MSREENFWGRFFANAPKAEAVESLWPGILAKIEAELERRESFGTALLWMGRRLTPAFALSLLIVLGSALSGGNDALLPDLEPALASLMDPEAVLSQWAGAPE